MLKQSKEAARHVEAVLSALDILDCFQTETSLTLKEIIDKTGLTRSRAMRLIGTLESRAYLAANPDTKTYHPGVKLPLLAKSYDKINQVEILIRPVLKQLAEEIGESATLYIQDGLDRVALAREEGGHFIRYVIQEGQRHPLSRGGASSKVLLAFGPEELTEAVLADYENGRDAFAQQIENIRNQKYAYSTGENTPGAHSLSTPVFNAHKKLVGALTISGPASRMTEEKIENWATLLVQVADHLSSRL